MHHNTILLIVTGAFMWALITADVDSTKLANSGPRLMAFIGRMASLDFSIWPELLKGLAETLRIAILGSAGSIALSAILGVLASDTLMKPIIWRPTRMLLAVIRAIPLILVAMLMVGAVGLGPLPGILAIAFHATGMLAKFYAEAIDGVQPGPVVALESAGASGLQKLRYAIWPQMAVTILRDTIFRIELNLRESLILGIVGAGGIGLSVHTYVRSFQYGKAATATLVVIIVVLSFEAINTMVKKKYS